MPLGPALAMHLAHRLVELRTSERALVLQLPAWPSRAAAPGPVAVAMVREGAWHVLAAIDAWSAIMAPPPALVGLGRRWEWGPEGPDAEALAQELAGLASRWWEEAPRAVGALDVAGALTQALDAACSAERTAFGNFVHAVPGADPALNQACVGIGRDHGPLRGPELAHVRATADGVVARLLTEEGGEAQTCLADVAALARALPELVAQLRDADRACVAWSSRLDALAKGMRAVRAHIPPPVAGGRWRATKPTEIALGSPPGIVLRTQAISGDGCAMRVSAHGEGMRVQVGDAVFDVARAADLHAQAPAITAALAREASTLRAETLAPGARYRVLRAFGGVSAGEVLVLRRVVELKPSGADAWLFEVSGRVEDARRTLTLRADLPADVAVLDAIGDHLAPLG